MIETGNSRDRRIHVFNSIKIEGMKNWKLVILVLVELAINFVVFVKLNKVYPLSFLLDPSLYCLIVLSL